MEDDLGNPVAGDVAQLEIVVAVIPRTVFAPLPRRGEAVDEGPVGGDQEIDGTAQVRTRRTRRRVPALEEDDARPLEMRAEARLRRARGSPRPRIERGRPGAGRAGAGRASGEVRRRRQEDDLESSHVSGADTRRAAEEVARAGR